VSETVTCYTQSGQLLLIAAGFSIGFAVASAFGALLMMAAEGTVTPQPEPAHEWTAATYGICVECEGDSVYPGVVRELIKGRCGKCGSSSVTDVRSAMEPTFYRGVRFRVSA
jgi:hypothetical protein